MKAETNMEDIATTLDLVGKAASRQPGRLEVEGLTVSFDGFRAVDNLDLCVESCELRVIIGPNGAGKTTLLDMICGKTRPSAGRVVFDGRDLAAMPEHEIVRAGVGRKFQAPSVYEDLTVLENFEISMPNSQSVLRSVFFRRNADVVARIDKMADTVFLRDHLHSKAGRLSHGQKQWLEIGMLLMQEPKLLLLDEPTTGLDVSVQALVLDTLKRLQRERRMTIVIVSHDLGVIRTLADRVIVMRQGRVVERGLVDQVFQDPQHPYTQQLVHAKL